MATRVSVDDDHPWGAQPTRRLADLPAMVSEFRFSIGEDQRTKGPSDADYRANRYDRSMTTLPDMLRRALAGPLPGLDVQVRMQPRLRTGMEERLAASDLRPAAALLLVYPHEGAWYVPLTLRGSGLRHHTGQVSLPGGRVDPGESVEEAALREAHEEVAVEPAAVEVLGRLTPLPIAVSRHLLHPVVGLTPTRPAFRVAEPEVERLIEVPVARLQRPNAIRWEERTRSRPPRTLMDVPYFDVEDSRIWGATAMVLAEFLALIGDFTGVSGNGG